MSAADPIAAGYEARRAGDPAGAARTFADAVERFRAEGARRSLVRALMGAGQIERDEGRGDGALPYYEEAVELARAEGDAQMLAHVVRHLGDLHQDAGRLADAAPCYEEALALYRGKPETTVLALANAVRPFAILRARTGEVEAARALWTEARALYGSLGLREGVDEADAAIARLDGPE